MRTRELAVRAPTVADLDPRLLTGAGRIELGAIIAQHDAPVGSCCPQCRWPVGGLGQQRTCPSRALARAIRDRRPVPAWLVHLVDDIPGARTATPPVDRAVEDARPGLFDPLPRQELS